MDSDTHRWSRRALIGVAVAASVPRFAWAATPDMVLRASDGRAVTVSVWRAKGRRKGTILFSHGALSAPWKYKALLEPWAAGYDIFAPLHVDSTDHPDTAKYPGLASWAKRLEDMHLLAARVGGRRYIAAGHSYGGLVALTLGGAVAVRPERYSAPMADKRVKAAVAFSPPGPMPKLIDAAGYATLGVPAFIQTGDKDVPPGGAPGDWKPHLTAFEAPVPGGHRYGLVLEGVDHYFGNIICRPERTEPPQSAQFADAVALSSLFLDAYGADDRRARAALDRRLTNEGAVRLMRR